LSSSEGIFSSFNPYDVDVANILQSVAEEQWEKGLSQ